MAEDFTGVPADQWQGMTRDTSEARLLALIALSLSVLLVLTLIDRGTLSGWSDIFRLAHTHE